MKIVRDFNDYMLDMIVEAILTKEAPLLFSERFKNLLKKIDHPISSQFQTTEYLDGYKSTYIDLDDSGLDKVSFITVNKAIEIIADQRGEDKEKDEITVSRTKFMDVRYDNDLKDKMYSKFRSVTTIGRLINKLYPDKFPAGGKPGEDIQSFADKFKSIRDPGKLELVSGEDIIYWYDAENYLMEEGTLGNSCMRYDYCAGYIEFYAGNPKVCQLLILKAVNEDGEEKIKGRALVWKLTSPSDRMFMDRIYTIDVYDEELFKAYAKKEGWFYKVKQASSDSGQLVDTRDDSVSYQNLYVGYVNSSKSGEYPYMDTLKYYSDNEGALSNDSGQFGRGNYWELSDTDGGYEEQESGTYVDYYGDYFDEDDLVYCELGDDYRTEDDAVYIDFYGKSATERYIDRNMVECDYYSNRGYGGNNAYRETEDTVEVYDTNEIACSDYASNNMTYSQYVDAYLPPDEDVWSEHHGDYLYRPESTLVYLDEGQRETDWRADDDGTWWEWEHDGDKYDNDVSEDDLREYHGLDDEDEDEEDDEHIEIVDKEKGED